MKLEFTRDDIHMIRNALACQLAQSEKSFERSGALCFKLEAKCWFELISNLDKQYDEYYGG